VSYLFPSSTITLDAALRDLARGSPRGRAFAAHALGDVTEPAARARAVPALIAALDDDRAEVRAEVCASLGDLGDAAAIAGLARKLGDPAADVQRCAAIALGSLGVAGHAAGFDPLAAALRDGPPALRPQAAVSLAEIDPARAFDPLVAALADPAPPVVAAAAISLGAIRDPRAAPLLAPHLDHADPATRFDVAYALAELRDGRGRGLLTAALAEPARVWDALTALAWLAAPQDADAIAGCLVRKGTPPEATLRAAGVLLAIAPASRHVDAARRVLIAALTVRKVHLRGLAVEQLAEVGGPWATEPLTKLAASGKGKELAEPIADALAAIASRGAA
jgi:HEAT repeat protein